MCSGVLLCGGVVCFCLCVHPSTAFVPKNNILKKCDLTENVRGVYDPAMKGAQIVIGLVMSSLDDGLLDDQHERFRQRSDRRIDMAKKRAKKAHPGFKSVQSKIARKQGVSKKAAGAILASRTRKASPAAKRRNPRLKRVK